MRVAIFFVAALGAACSGPDTEDSLRASTFRPQNEANLVLDAGGPGPSEVEARLLLDAMFREAGLRIVNDFYFTASDIEVTLDGYDPAEEVGYEFVAHQEEGLDLSEQERKALMDTGMILIASGGTLELLEVQAAAFLAPHAERPRRDDGEEEP